MELKTAGQAGVETTTGQASPEVRARNFQIVGVCCIGSACILLGLAGVGPMVIPALRQNLIRIVLGVVGITDLVMGIGFLVASQRGK